MGCERDKHWLHSAIRLAIYLSLSFPLSLSLYLNNSRDKKSTICIHFINRVDPTSTLWRYK